MSSTPDRARLRLGRVAATVLLAAAVLGACSSSGDDGDDKAATSTTTSAERSTTTKADGSSTTAAADAGAAAWDRDAQEHRGQDGKTFDYECPAGGEATTIWGTETYTDDSSVCTAAVHVGLITFDEGGTVTIEIAPGLDLYEDGTANGITSTRYASWDGSFTFPDAPPGSGTFTPGGQSWNVTGQQESLEVGDTATVTCSPAGTPGSVWGTDVYTADSSVCSAAAHAGLITVEDGGEVTFELAEGRDAYEGTEANGITSSSYGPFDQSITFPEDQPAN